VWLVSRGFYPFAYALTAFKGIPFGVLFSTMPGYACIMALLLPILMEL
jgi:hypothetical protein